MKKFGLIFLLSIFLAFRSQAQESEDGSNESGWL